MAQATRAKLSDRVLFKIFKALGLRLDINRSGLDGYFYYTIIRKLK